MRFVSSVLESLPMSLASTGTPLQNAARMNSVVSDKRYVPVLPYHGTLWPRALNLYLPRYLHRRYGTAKVDIVGDDKLRASIDAGHGILLTPNHSRDEDPFILSRLGQKVGKPFFVVASAHLLMGNKLQAFLLRRAGAFRSTARGWISRRSKRRSRF